MKQPFDFLSEVFVAGDQVCGCGVQVAKTLVDLSQYDFKVHAYFIEPGVGSAKRTQPFGAFGKNCLERVGQRAAWLAMVGSALGKTHEALG